MSSSYLLLGDLRAHYLGWNLAGGAAPPCCCTGWLPTPASGSWPPRFLADAGLRAFAPDLRGHGLTDKPDGDYGFDIYARDLAAFLNLPWTWSARCWWGIPGAPCSPWITPPASPSGPRSPAGLVLVDGGSRPAR